MQNKPCRFEPNEVWLPWIAKLVSGIGRAYNGYEIHGLEKLDPNKTYLLVFYHGLMPLDFWYFGMSYYEHLKRPVCGLADRFLFKTPGLSWLTKTVGGIEANRDAALKLLQQGVTVGVSPGGVKEAIAGGKNDYKLIWGNRKGFAELAMEAGVEIIPGFTENVESLYKSPLASSPIFQKLYEKTKLPLVPILGLGPLPFPVKLRTWIGDPISSKTATSAEELVETTRLAIENLINTHQDKSKGMLEQLRTRFDS